MLSHSQVMRHGQPYSAYDAVDADAMSQYSDTWSRSSGRSSAYETSDYAAYEKQLQLAGAAQAAIHQAPAPNFWESQVDEGAYRTMAASASAPTLR